MHSKLTFVAPHELGRVPVRLLKLRSSHLSCWLKEAGNVPVSALWDATKVAQSCTAATNTTGGVLVTVMTSMVIPLNKFGLFNEHKGLMCGRDDMRNTSA